MNNRLGLYKRLLTYIKPYQRQMLVAILGMLASAVSQPMLAYATKLLLDEGFINQQSGYVMVVPLLFVAIALFSGIADYLVGVYTELVSQSAIATIRQQMFAKLHTTSAVVLDQSYCGQLISKVSYDVAQVTNALSTAWVTLIRDSLVVIALTAYLMYVSWQLSVVIFIIAPAVFWIMKKASEKMRNYSQSLQNNMGQLTHVLQEAIDGYREVRLFEAQEAENKRFQKTTQEVRNNSIRIKRITALNVPMIQILASISMVLIIYLAVFLKSTDSLSVGEFVSYIVAMMLLFEPIRELTKVNPEIQKGLVAAKSIFALLDQTDEVDQGSRKLSKLQGDIEFRQLGFAFKDPLNPLFRDLNLIIKATETVAIVGQSGSGKTTLINLLARFYTPQKGQILIDGVAIDEFSLKFLRSQIALVSQQAMLFNDTIRANVAYGINAHASDEEIRHHLQLADAWQFVDRLPQGLDSLVGDSGSNLSGGQRQRITLARAFLKNAPILVLDEASSALDNETETKVQTAIERLARGRTTIIIAHRMSTIRKATRVIVMKQGQIVEQGDHASLMTLNGEYAKLYQFGELT